MSNIHVIYMHLICVKCELQNGSMSFLHFPFFSNFYQLHMLLDSLICKDAHTIFWASFVINIFPQLHIFTEIIYVVPHVKYCTRFIMLTSSWLACNKTWYCENAHCFCNHFIICCDFWNLISDSCLFVFSRQNVFRRTTEMRDPFYVRRSLTFLSTHLRFTSQYVSYPCLQLIESKKQSFSTWLMSIKGLSLELALNIYVLTSFSLIWLLHLHHCWVFHHLSPHWTVKTNTTQRHFISHVQTNSTKRFYIEPQLTFLLIV